MTTTLLRRAAAWLALALLLNLALPALDHHALERDPAHGHAPAAGHAATSPHHHAFEFPHDHQEPATVGPPRYGAPAGGAALVVLVEPHDDGATGAASGGTAYFRAGPHGGATALTLQVQSPRSQFLLGVAPPVAAPPPEATLA